MDILAHLTAAGTPSVQLRRLLPKPGDMSSDHEQAAVHYAR